MMVMIRRQMRVNRMSMIVMAILWAINSVAQTVAYDSIFPDPAARAKTLEAFTNNGALRAIYGFPYDITNATGWLAWRSMGFVVIVIAMWAAFITVGALRGEEEAGRAELALSQPHSRRIWFTAALAAVAIETLVIGAANVVGLIAVCVTTGQMSILDALAIGLQLVLPGLLFIAVGAVSSQLFTTARAARIAVAGVLLLAFFARTAADVGGGMTWLRWVLPLGWFEELHPPAAPSIFALIVIVVAGIALYVVALRLLAIRDIGIGLLPHRDSRPPRRFLLGAPWRAALRDDIPQLSMWALGTVLCMLLVGSLTKLVLDLVKSFAAFSSIVGTNFAINAYAASLFSLVQIVVTLLLVTMMVAARGEESSGRLELLVAQPLTRVGWLLSRTGLAVGAALILALLSALAFWGGATLSGQSLGLLPMLEAGLNCLPLIIITAGVATAMMAFVPRAVAFLYVVIAVAYLGEALGTALKAPSWLLDFTPFHWLAAVPAQDFALVPAIAMTSIGLGLGGVSAFAFRRRDLAIG